MIKNDIVYLKIIKTQIHKNFIKKLQQLNIFLNIIKKI